MSKITITLTENKKTKPDYDNLGFGNYFTDHMFIMNYTEGKGWYSPRIIPYGDINLDPTAMVFHYGQEVFEGLKAYKALDGRTLLFRPDMNMKRMNSSNDRLCIPKLDVDFAIDAINELVKVDSDWIPDKPGTSLYIRPFVIATDPFLGVRAANNYMFIIVLSPVGAYYPEGLNPVKIFVESELVRAVKGGTGFTKCGGNYGASIKAQNDAKHNGYSQVLWLDGVERKYIEEVGTMNVFFVIDGEVITPALDGSILPGVTRDSCLQLLKDMGYKVTERKLSIEEVFKAAENGKLNEMFGTGTAAVISPVGELRWGDKVILINGGNIGKVSQTLYDTLTEIQWGEKPGPAGWSVEIK